MSSDPGNPMRADALIDRERIRGAARVIAEGMDASAVTSEQIQQVAADLEIHTRNYKISRKEVATAVGYSAGVVSEFLKGSYAGNNGQVAIDLENWLVEDEHRRSAPQTTQFVWTNVALLIKGVSSYCLDERSIGLIYGPDTSGMGKTTALRAIHQVLGPRRCTLITIDKVDANPTGLLRKICSAIGIQESGSNRQRFSRLVEKLSGRSHLLIIDQAHNLRFSKDDKPFYILTDLFDATNSAQLWCGTSDLFTYLRTQRSRRGDESLTQVASRLYPQIDLIETLKGSSGGNGPICVDVAQVREMFRMNKLRLAGGAAQFLCELANTPDSGSLCLCIQIVKYATFLGTMRNLSCIDVPLLQEALRCGLTSDRAELLLKEARIESTQIVRSA